jgi:predicted metal-binding membrane protein
MFVSNQDSGQGNNSLKLWQDRGTLLTGALLIVIAALAWIAVVRQAMGMHTAPMTDSDMGMSMQADAGMLSLTDATAYLAAWGVMMTAMMLPSAAPMIALYGALHRNRSKTGSRGISTALFALVYIIVWLAFGVPVYLAGQIIDVAARANPVIADLLPYAIALTLLAAGLFQFSPLKRVCLRVCQHPFVFLLGHWRSGYAGTLRMALEHAIYCVGCCWALMVILVAAGAMALHWVLLIAAVVFAEKVLPRGEWAARIVGAALVLLGVLVAVQPGLVALLRGSRM